ncbi:hypothetical protein GO755_36035 [Spirosoma sp. HMF4905]|uniref:Uncharacterized protein n=1 Tax=Spirosoma arboris TaxID=2682092 RepID=A0A7K1SNV6_9BACT|nr:hypothetical protein [Spirosoma arboris]MVM35488.1 hypothetical protein [Spirosoma arboris]
MPGKRKQKHASRPKPVAQMIPQSSASDRYLEEADRRLNSLGHGLSAASTPQEVAAAREALDTSIGLILQGFALWDVEQAEQQLSQGHLSQKDYQQRVDQALDRFNKPAEVNPGPSKPPIHIEGPNGEFIYICEQD